MIIIKNKLTAFIFLPLIVTYSLYAGRQLPKTPTSIQIDLRATNLKITETYEELRTLSPDSPHFQ